MEIDDDRARIPGEGCRLSLLSPRNPAARRPGHPAIYNRLAAADNPKMVALIASPRKLPTIHNVMIREGTTRNPDQQTT